MNETKQALEAVAGWQPIETAPAVPSGVVSRRYEIRRASRADEAMMRPPSPMKETITPGSSPPTRSQTFCRKPGSRAARAAASTRS